MPLVFNVLDEIRWVDGELLLVEIPVAFTIDAKLEDL